RSKSSAEASLSSMFVPCCPATTSVRRRWWKFGIENTREGADPIGQTDRVFAFNSDARESCRVPTLAFVTIPPPALGGPSQRDRAQPKANLNDRNPNPVAMPVPGAIAAGERRRARRHGGRCRASFPAGRSQKPVQCHRHG